MGQTVQKWGNSLAVRIPKALASELHLQNGSEVELSSEDGALVLRPRAQRARRKYDLEEMLSRITEENMQPFIDLGPPVGREIWEYEESPADALRS
ncbi:MAG: AbrB/MazE/SpoVT family DNA-binding domain-containing protein [Armatimonadetes bacterium]|nr:AbrB/MazE/SpoVT family DNA-binding domain-containing protein [Armatimonadota bacterium]